MGPGWGGEFGVEGGEQGGHDRARVDREEVFRGDGDEDDAGVVGDAQQGAGSGGQEHEPPVVDPMACCGIATQ